ERLSDVNNALANPDIRALFCARGGYGSARIVDAIDYDSLSTNPKIIVGYSDITTLLIAITKKTGLITFHGPLIGSQKVSTWSYQMMLRQLTSSEKAFIWPSPPDGFPPPQIIRSGSGSGPLVGGCLSILSTLSGTVNQPDTSGSVLFMEEVAEAPYRVDRLLSHLHHSGWFNNPSGILIGAFERCIQRDEDQEPSLSISEILQDRFSEKSFPVLSGLPIGHGRHNITIPVGIECMIEESQIIQLHSGIM
ncbi:LD-carboxypeptidase, partial [bacterium]|nr:LD-carboxypeptidase [candidate division CSSED10-310 bacterium]